jgi:PAS domain S-box-containing protein
MNLRDLPIPVPEEPGSPAQTDDRNRREATGVRLELAHMEETLRAIRGCEVDALFVAGAAGQRLFTLHGADRAYRMLIEEMGEGAITLTSEGVVAYANRRFSELLARPLGEVIGSRIDSCFAPERQDALSRLLVDGSFAKCSAEMDLLAADGSYMPVLVSVNRLVIDGLPDALCMIVTDLTAQKHGEAANLARQTLLKFVEDQKRAEESLRLSLEALRLRDNALGAISQGVLISDRQGLTTYANQACEAMSGYSAAEMHGRSASILQGEETNPVAVQALRTAISGALPFHGELLNYRKDGTTFRNELSVTPVFDERGAT